MFLADLSPMKSRDPYGLSVYIWSWGTVCPRGFNIYFQYLL